MITAVQTAIVVSLVLVAASTRSIAAVLAAAGLVGVGAAYLEARLTGAGAPGALALETWLVTALGTGAVVAVVMRTWRPTARGARLRQRAVRALLGRTASAGASAVSRRPAVDPGALPYWFRHRGVDVRHDDDWFVVGTEVFASEHDAVAFIDERREQGASSP